MNEGNAHVRRRQQFVAGKDHCQSNEESVFNITKAEPKTPTPRKWVLTPTSSTKAVVLLLLVLVPFFLLIILGRTLGFRFFPRHLRGRQPPLNVISKKPANNLKISVVIMNHDRPNVLRLSTLLPTLAQHDCVLEILLLHSNPKSAFDSNTTFVSRIQDVSQLKKLRDIDAVAMNDKMGLALRFHYCATSATANWVLVMDDDIEIDATAIDALLFHMQMDPKRIVGHFGRSLVQPSILSILFFHQPKQYDTKTVYGHVEIVLTKLLILERDVCVQFLNHMHVMDDLVKSSKPLWNGEDIFASLVANRYYGVPFNGPYRNLAVAELPVWEADIPERSRSDVGSISGNLDDHRIWKVGFSQWKAAYTKAQKHNFFRGRFWRTAKERLYRLDAWHDEMVGVSLKIRFNPPEQNHS